MKKYKIPLFAFLVATAITSIMDFTGYIAFSALPLIMVTLIFWLVSRLTGEELGLRWGSWKDHWIAILYPFVVLGGITVVVYLTGNINVGESDWGHSLQFIGLATFSGILMGLLTEEGFFRGWLWGAFLKSGMTPKATLWMTAILFMSWHISAVTSGTEYGLPWVQVPVYLVNATFLGLIWGLMRQRSGSIVVTSVSHACWNGFTYQLFGFGTETGDLGITNTIIFGPETGLLGIAFNGLFFWWLYRKHKKETADSEEEV